MTGAGADPCGPALREEARATPVLAVEGLRVAFPGRSGPDEVVRGISFTIRPGEVLALVGESGSGKSVTARALVGLAGARARIRAEALRLTGHEGRALDLLGLSERRWRAVRGRQIGFVLQDALVSLDPLRRIGQEVAEPILAHRLLPRDAVAGEVQALLARVGIPDPANRAAQYPHELSGGLRQRALIASALAGRPRLLIADEPTTALDVTIQRQILAVFADLARAGHGLLLITHDLAVAAQVADTIAVMQHGAIVEAGPARAVLADPRHAYTRRLLAAVPGPGTRQSWLSRAGARPERVSDPRPAEPILEVRDVAVRFSRPGGAVDALAGVSLRVRRGETFGIVGESGSGKTTLGRVVLALQRADRGEVLFEGRPWSTLPERSRRPLRPRIQTIVQDPLGSFDPRDTVRRILEQPLRLQPGLAAGQRAARAAELMALVGLPREMLARRPRTLSGGQRQRVAIAQALAGQPDLLVCDEPVSALDVTTQAQILDLLTDLQHRFGLTLLLISHDLGVIQHMSDRVAVMKDGRIVETGPVEDIFAAPADSYTRRLLAALPALPARAAPEAAAEPIGPSDAARPPGLEIHA
ncbi:ABC transporter ATP-binding protein [Methylobacterium sp. J-072]|uniref:dipeptide ABC transporter ATP-binding protein n=1 Tax=Methylobacterium sp. J-072 TaxID=2836651 RepID=UPI001FB9912E|nr:ABC transporter ATP-binding protein [Methylobacterium sp. J-072]MCJ2091159.1 ABC transporter ATP-binding protein [Methylobacterium sp. J-072]